MKTRQDWLAALDAAMHNPEVTGIRLSVQGYIAALNAGAVDLLITFSSRKRIKLVP